MSATIGQFVYFADSSILTPDPRIFSRFLILSGGTQWNFIIVFDAMIASEKSGHSESLVSILYRGTGTCVTENSISKWEEKACRSTEALNGQWQEEGANAGCVLTRDEPRGPLTPPPSVVSPVPWQAIICELPLVSWHFHLLRRKNTCFGRILNCCWHHQGCSYVYAFQLCPRLL